MRSFAIIATALAAGSAVFAAPAAPADKRELNLGGLPFGGLIGGTPLAGVAGSGQNAVAEFFKLADAVLNIPTDSVRKLLEGNPVGAGTGLLQDILKTAGSLPKDAAGLVTPIVDSGKKQA